MDWPADHVERRPVAELIPYARNARTHSPEQVDQIAASIREWGWTTPVLVDEAGSIIAGHGRVLAAKKLRLAEVPVMVAEGWSDAQKSAYVIADNKLALNAGWDNELLKVELTGLKELDFDLGLTGFSLDELGTLLADKTVGLTDPDEVPDEPAIPVSELGDVWILGSHRLVCGDSTDALAVAAALNGVKPHLMVTDPPYGVEYDASWRNGVKRANGKVIGATALGKVENDSQADWRGAWALFPGDVAYVWHGGIHAGIVAESLTAADFKIRSQIIWRKQNFVISRGDYHWQHEPCWYAVRNGKTGHYDGGRKQSTLWDIAVGQGYLKPEGNHSAHSTQKPVECMKRPIENNSSPGQAVYEPFSGSGTTIIAAEMTGRSCHAIELSPAYVDVAVTRWAAFSGKTPTLESTGKTFVEVMALRQPSQPIKAKASGGKKAGK